MAVRGNESFYQVFALIRIKLPFPIANHVSVPITLDSGVPPKEGFEVTIIEMKVCEVFDDVRRLEPNYDHFCGTFLLPDKQDYTPDCTRFQLPKCDP